jgi:carbonic anhydrase/acetyltransferase-like protein (isoleucine patch superfamily)
LPLGNYWVAETAAVIGRVSLGLDACVWFGAVLRGDDDAIQLGDRSHILDNCVLHTDYGLPVVIGADCVVGPRAILHGCSIGSKSLIAAGVTMLNRAKVGRNCIVSPGTLVTEQQAFPDNSVIRGRPARLVETVYGNTALIQRIQILCRCQLYASKLKQIA